MKEIIVVENKAFLNKTDFVCIEDIVKDLKVEYTKEQVPENFSELKELCEDLESKNVFIINAGNCIEFNGLYFWKDGSITTTQNNNDIWATKTNLTPAKMWQIIKSLIGEE